MFKYFLKIISAMYCMPFAEEGGAPAPTPPAENPTPSETPAAGGTLLTGDDPTPPAGAPGDDPTPPAGDDPTPPAEGDKPKEFDLTEYAEVKLPDGMEVDTATLKTFDEQALALKMPQEARDKLVQMYADKMQQMHKDGINTYNETVKAYETDLRADPNLGGDNLPRTVSTSKRVLGSFEGGGELLTLLDSTGLGNHKAVHSFLNNIASKIGDDHLVTPQGAKPQASEKSLAQRIYPNMNP